MDNIFRDLILNFKKIYFFTVKKIYLENVSKSSKIDIYTKFSIVFFVKNIILNYLNGTWIIEVFKIWKLS